MQPHTEGQAAAKAGIKWWDNPYPSGSAYAYAWDLGHTRVRTATMPDVPHTTLTIVRPDEVAECWDGVEQPLYLALWDCVPHYKAPSPEESEEPCYGVDCVADFWDRFTYDQRVKLNELAAANTGEF